MNDFFANVEQHGYVVIFAVVFAEAIGLPVPAAVALVGGGAAVAAKVLNGPTLLLVAITGMLIGDTILFILGRYMGWTLLGLLCRLSMNPESCILNSAESFYKRGKLTLVFAKFVPGVNTMSPPLAGSMRMKAGQFLRLDFLGVLLYIFAYGALGYLGRDALNKISHGFQTARHVVGAALLIAFVAYIAYRFWLYYKNREYRVVPRVQVQELARKLAEESDKVTIVDVRSHGYYDAGVQRIKGSVRIEPNNLEEELKHLSKDKEIYLYCT